VYPPGQAIPTTCDTTPRHGFSTECGANQATTTTPKSGGCVLAAAPAPASGAAIALGLGALGLAAHRRRSRRRTSRDGNSRARQ
jgi:hypothetical protein